MEEQLKEVIDLLRDDYDNLMDKSNDLFKDKCILMDKIEKLKNLIKIMNELIQNTDDNDIFKLKAKLDTLKRISVLNYKLIINY